MKKSAILTYYYFNNYGTALQLYGLNKTIMNMGIRNDIIDYIPGQIYKESAIERIIKYHFYIDRLRCLAKNYLYKKYVTKINANVITDDIKNKASKFELFRSTEFTFSKKCKTASELFQLNDCYDVFVCGSDQIWSPHAFNPRYYFDFISDANKMVAYAPSIGENNIKNKYIAEKMNKLISRFYHLSVREDIGKDIIYRLTKKNNIHVLDPSMLLNKNDYDEIINKYTNRCENGKYILCYFLGDKERYWKCIKRLSKETKLPVKIIPVFYKDYIRPFEYTKETGPAEFLQLIRNAAFVCTDSFHGTVFSIIYNKIFFVFERFHKHDPENQNSRIYSLLKLFFLEDRLVHNYKDIQLKLHSIIDFNRVNSILDEQKKISIDYLADALQPACFNKSENHYLITNTCSGCGACELICKKKAIKIILNGNGFYEAAVDNNLCIHCKECRSVCPYGSAAPVKITYKHSLFAVFSKNIQVLKTSSSGGLGRELAEYFHGVAGSDVFGCTYNVLKRRAETIYVCPDDHDKIRLLDGSKYIQSNMSGIYKKLITSNGGVFFGTPCQTAGVNLFLQKYKKRQSFVLVDLICHGIPSDLLWQKYLSEGDKKYKYGMNPEVQFRYKKYGWRKKYMYIGDGGYIKKDTKDMFYKFFLAGSCNMDACYECKFRDSSSADIRMGDYWGPRFNKNKTGVSMVLPMSDSGEKVLKILQETGRIFMEKTDINDYFNCQQTVNIPKPIEYDHILEDLRNNTVNLKAMADKYRRYYEISNRVYNFLYPIIQTVKIYRKKWEI